MPIYETATYRVNASGVGAVTAAIDEFVDYVRSNEPGTRMYQAWQRQDDPTSFLHLFIFADEDAQRAHSESAAVARFEATYSPELVGGDVVFTDFDIVAANDFGRDGDAAGEAAVRRFEDEFKNRENLDVVDELMTPDFVHHMPFPGLQPGREGMKDVGRLIFGAIRDIRVTVDLVVSANGFVADRVAGAGVRKDNGEPITWVENHIYRIVGGRIAELWPAGGPQLG